MNNRLVLTGSSGFLGFNILKYLCIEQCFQQIAALTSQPDALKKRMNYLRGNNIVEIYEACTICTGQLQLDKEDIVLNCAYPRAGTGTDIAKGLEYIESVFQAASNSKVKGIINISSQSVYNPQRVQAATEDDLPFLYDQYTIGKYCTEILLRNICRDISHTNIRLASLIGAGFNDRVPNKMIKAALDSGIIHVELNQKKFGYLDVEDAARALIMVASAGSERWEEVYNLGMDGTYTLSDIADSIQRNLMQLEKRSVEIITHNGSASSNSALCNCRIKTLIGEYAQNTLDKSIETIILNFV